MSFDLQAGVVGFLMLAVVCAGPPLRAEPARADLGALAALHGLQAPRSRSGNVYLNTGARALTFLPQSRRFNLDGVLFWMNGPLERGAKGWTVPQCDAQTLIAPLLDPAAFLGDAGDSLVVLDPGHGGEDSGAVGGGGVSEKTLVLDITRRARKKLEASCVKTHMTRDSDSYPSLSTRIARTRHLRADLMVSVHLNFARNSGATGVESYVLAAPGFESTNGGKAGKRPCPGNRFDAASALLAYRVQKGILVKTRAVDRGVRRARYEILRNAPSPAVLVECGFLSAPEELRKLVDPQYRDAIAEGIASGILTYLTRVSDTRLRQTGPRPR